MSHDPAGNTGAHQPRPAATTYPSDRIFMHVVADGPARWYASYHVAFHYADRDRDGELELTSAAPSCRAALTDLCELLAMLRVAHPGAVILTLDVRACEVLGSAGGFLREMEQEATSRGWTATLS